VVQAIQGTSFATEALANVSLNAFFERREIRVAQFLAADFAAQVKPTEAEIEAFYSSNAALFLAPEQADVEYLVLDAAALEKSVVLAEADELGHDQQRQCHQKAHLRVDVEQERDLDGGAPSRTLDDREHQQWQPGKQRDDDNAPLDKLERAAGETGTPEELEERATQNEREIVRHFGLARGDRG
jgi:hypothetical protein